MKKALVYGRVATRVQLSDQRITKQTVEHLRTIYPKGTRVDLVFDRRSLPAHRAGPQGRKYEILPFFWLPEETIDLRVKRDHQRIDLLYVQRLAFFKSTPGWT